MSVGLVGVRIHVRWRAWAERVSNVFVVPLLEHCLTSFRLNLVYVRGFIMWLCLPSFAMRGSDGTLAHL